jgi:hypothetical protein
MLMFVPGRGVGNQPVVQETSYLLAAGRSVSRRTSANIRDQTARSLCFSIALVTDWTTCVRSETIGHSIPGGRCQFPDVKRFAT